MNSRERLLAALHGKQVDRLPWAPLIDEYYTSSLPEQGYNMDVLSTLRFVGADILERHVQIYKSHFRKVEKRIVKKDNLYMEELITPVGTINQVTTISDGGRTSFLTKPYITKEEEAKIFQYVVEDQYHTPDFESFVNRQESIGNDGLATVSSPLTPIQQLLQYLMHIEPFTYGLFDYQEALEELMEAMHYNSLQAYSLIAQSPAEVIFSYEDTSTTVMSPSWYDSYCKDYLDQYSDVLHGSGKIYITHMCGKLKGFGKSIKEGKMNGIDSVCPPTTGDTWLHEALEMWPGKVIIGGIEPPALRRMSVLEARDYVTTILEKVPSGSNIILSTGDATSYGTPIENIIEITKVINEFSGNR